MDLLRKAPTKLSTRDAEFERQRFEFHAPERKAHLDDRANEAWELYHYDRDGTDTQYTRKQVAQLEQVGAPKVSINFIMPIISNQKAILTGRRCASGTLRLPMDFFVVCGGLMDRIGHEWFPLSNLALKMNLNTGPVFVSSI